MTEWVAFAVALGLFLASHVVPARPPVRAWLVERLGRRGFAAAYGLLSLALLGWLIVAAAGAPHVEVIAPLPVLRWVPLVAMPVACLLAAAGLGATNPLSFGGLGRRDFDPARPGILGFSRHPLLLAMAIWAAAHLLANGDLAHVILFGLFAGYAGSGMAVIDRRRRRDLGRAEWDRLARRTALVSLSGLRLYRPDILSVLAAAAGFAAILWLHLPVIGVSPLP